MAGAPLLMRPFLDFFQKLCNFPSKVALVVFYKTNLRNYGWTKTSWNCRDLPDLLKLATHFLSVHEFIMTMVVRKRAHQSPQSAGIAKKPKPRVTVRSCRKSSNGMYC